MKTGGAFSILILAAMLLAGCEEDRYFKDLYTNRCPEAQTVRFEDLAPASTCMGRPILLELAGLAISPERGALERLAEFLNRRGFDFDVQDPVTGRTPLMTALAANRQYTAEVLLAYSKNPNLLDKAGNHYLHYAARVQFYRGMADKFAKSGDREARDGNGLTPLGLAYSQKNYGFVWALISAGANFETLVEDPLALDPSFLFHEKLEDNAAVFLDKVSVLWNQKFSGPAQFNRTVFGLRHPYSSGESRPVQLKDYGFTEAARDLCAPKLAEALRARGLLGQTVLPCRSWPDSTGGLISYYINPEYSLYIYNDGPWLDSEFQNELGQNFAHYYLATMSSDRMNKDFNVWSGGLEQFIGLAVKKQWMNQPDNFGMTPAFYYLSSSEQKQSPGFWGRRSARARLQLVLQHTARLDQVNANGDSLLSYAVATGQLEYVQIVFASHPRMSVLARTPNQQRMTPLDLARERGFGKIYEYLANAR